MSIAGYWPHSCYITVRNCQRYKLLSLRRSKRNPFYASTLSAVSITSIMRSCGCYISSSRSSDILCESKALEMIFTISYPEAEVCKMCENITYWARSWQGASLLCTADNMVTKTMIRTDSTRRKVAVRWRICNAWRCFSGNDYCVRWPIFFNRTLSFF